MTQQMFDVTDHLTVQLIKTIPIKVVSWLQVMGKYVPESIDVNHDIAGIEIKISSAENEQRGSISIIDENISITWLGDFPTDMHTFKVSNAAFTSVQADLAALICLEHAFYDRLQSLQHSLEHSDNLGQKMATAAAEHLAISREQ